MVSHGRCSLDLLEDRKGALPRDTLRGGGHGKSGFGIEWDLLGDVLVREKKKRWERERSKWFGRAKHGKTEGKGDETASCV